MLLLLVLVFIGVFMVLTLVLVASGTGASQQAKQTLAVLQSALAVNNTKSGDPIVDIRKSELLSAVPWINRLLLQFEIAPRSRVWLYTQYVRLSISSPSNGIFQNRVSRRGIFTTPSLRANSCIDVAPAAEIPVSVRKAKHFPPSKTRGP